MYTNNLYKLGVILSIKAACTEDFFLRGGDYNPAGGDRSIMGEDSPLMTCVLPFLPENETLERTWTCQIVQDNEQLGQNAATFG